MYDKDKVCFFFLNYTHLANKWTSHSFTYYLEVVSLSQISCVVLFLGSYSALCSIQLCNTTLY